MSITRSGATPQPPTKLKRSYRWPVLHVPGWDALFSVGIHRDGTLWNPNGYDPERLRTAVMAKVEERIAAQRQRRSDGAKQAAKTRARRVEKEIRKAAVAWLNSEKCEPRDRCRICGKRLDDPQSYNRGIGPECWQHVLDDIERLKAEGTAPDPSSPSAADPSRRSP
jgi:hypothetical protein